MGCFELGRCVRIRVSLILGPPMYLICLRYRVPLNTLDEYLIEHRAYLDRFYQAGQLLLSGPQDPRIGGVIVALFECRSEVDSFIQSDPFYIHKLADYEVTSFSPVKYHDCLSDLLSKR